MAKVSIGLRGWRFEESDVFTEDGEYRPLDEMPEEPRQRLVRLSSLIGEPCDACYLVHGDEEIRRCNEATLVYGEPREEVLLCDDHEADFLYWYREAGGKAHRGEAAFRDAFHEWFADGGRAPAGYAGLDHVDTDPETLPDPPTGAEIERRLNAGFEGRRIDILAYGDDEDDVGDAEDLDLDGLDLGREYPRK